MLHLLKMNEEKKMKEESRKTKKIVKIEEKNYETKDLTKPVITVFYNQDKFVNTKDKKAILEFDEKSYEFENRRIFTN